MMTSARDVSRALVDGTGLSHGELALLATAAAAGTAVLVLLRMYDRLREVLPAPVRR